MVVQGLVVVLAILGSSASWTEPASLRPAAERRTSDGGAERRITVGSVPSGIR